MMTWTVGARHFIGPTVWEDQHAEAKTTQLNVHYMLRKPEHMLHCSQDKKGENNQWSRTHGRGILEHARDVTNWGWAKKGGWAGWDPAFFSANHRTQRLLVTHRGHVGEFGIAASHMLFTVWPEGKYFCAFKCSFRCNIVLTHGEKNCHNKTSNKRKLAQIVAGLA